MFSFKSVGHWFAVNLVHDVKAAVAWGSTHQAQIDTTLQTGAALIGIANPALAPIAAGLDRAGEQILGDALAVAHTADDATIQKGTSLVLDTQTLLGLKKLIADGAALKPTVLAHPADLPVTAPATA